MPKVIVKVPHDKAEEKVVELVKLVVNKVLGDFQGENIQVDWNLNVGTFSCTSLGFQITGGIQVSPNEVEATVILPIAAFAYKNRVQKSLEKNLGKALCSNED